MIGILPSQPSKPPRQVRVVGVVLVTDAGESFAFEVKPPATIRRGAERQLRIDVIGDRAYVVEA